MATLKPKQVAFFTEIRKSALWADLETVITGLPTIRCATSIDGSSCEPTEGRRTTILKETSEEGTKYYWVIDGHSRPVIYSVSGLYEIFTDPGGSGMVVVMVTAEHVKAWKDLSAFQGKPGPPVRYMEVTRLALTTISLFGGAERYSP